MGAKGTVQACQAPRALVHLGSLVCHRTKREPAACLAGAGGWRRGRRQDANPRRPRVFWGERPQVFKERLRFQTLRKRIVG